MPFIVFLAEDLTRVVHGQPFRLSLSFLANSRLPFISQLIIVGQCSFALIRIHYQWINCQHYLVSKQATVDNFPVGVRWISGLIWSALFQVEKLNILSKSRYNVDLILVMYYISAGQTSLLQVQWEFTLNCFYVHIYIYIVNGCWRNTGKNVIKHGSYKDFEFKY